MICMDCGPRSIEEWIHYTLEIKHVGNDCNQIQTTHDLQFLRKLMETRTVSRAH